MRITTGQLRMFVQIIDSAGLTRAATVTGVSQPTLSSSLARFEKELGQKVFERTGGTLTLTAAGRALESIARRTIASSTALTELVDEITSGTAGVVSIAISRADPHLIPLATTMRFFAAEHPHIQMRLRFYPTPTDTMRAIETGAESVGFAPARVAHGTLDYFELPIQPFCLAIPAHRPRRPTLADMAQDGVLPFLHTVGLPAGVPAWFEQHHVQVRVVVADALPGVVVTLLEQGVGSVLIPVSMMTLLAPSGVWSVSLPPDFPPLGEPMALIYRATTLTPPIKRFIQMARRESDRAVGGAPPASTEEAPLAMDLA